MCDLGWLELTAISGQFGLLYRQVYRRVSKQSSMQGSGHGSNQDLKLCLGVGNCLWQSKQSVVLLVINLMQQILNRVKLRSCCSLS